ncbi:MAG: bis-aminopropyl spermidine synthase family protein, partial [Oscillospiraceae bacterium]|nr:bis-aminopropyl spermidine synthase family protein [Oscillospiraceae bacterium]
MNFIDAFGELCARVNPMEGGYVLLRMLALLYLCGPMPAKGLALALGMPIPVISAANAELIRMGMALREPGGAALTERGRAAVALGLGFGDMDLGPFRDLVGLGPAGDGPLPHAAKRSFEAFAGLEEELGRIYAMRPTVDVSLDQSLCTPATGLRRAALWLAERLSPSGEVIVLGDDDLVSVSLCMAVRRLRAGDHPGCGALRVTVLELDGRFVEFLRSVAAEHGLPMEVVQHDLREALPEGLVGRHDCAYADPPYTLQGLELFLSRAAQALKEGPGPTAYISFGNKPPAFKVGMQRVIVGMGFAMEAIHGGFNEYEGAGVLGGRGSMHVLRSSGTLTPTVVGAYVGDLYTGDLRVGERDYRCAACGLTTKVGRGMAMATVEALKGS